MNHSVEDAQLLASKAQLVSLFSIPIARLANAQAHLTTLQHRGDDILPGSDACRFRPALQTLVEGAQSAQEQLVQARNLVDAIILVPPETTDERC